MTWWRLEGKLFGRFEEAEGQNKKITEVWNNLEENRSR